MPLHLITNAELSQKSMNTPFKEKNTIYFMSEFGIVNDILFSQVESYFDIYQIIAY